MTVRELIELNMMITDIEITVRKRQPVGSVKHRTGTGRKTTIPDTGPEGRAISEKLRSRRSAHVPRCSLSPEINKLMGR